MQRAIPTASRLLDEVVVFAAANLPLGHGIAAAAIRIAAVDGDGTQSLDGRLKVAAPQARVGLPTDEPQEDVGLPSAIRTERRRLHAVDEQGAVRRVVGKASRVADDDVRDGEL